MKSHNCLVAIHHQQHMLRIYIWGVTLFYLIVQGMTSHFPFSTAAQKVFLTLSFQSSYPIKFNALPLFRSNRLKFHSEVRTLNPTKTLDISTLFSAPAISNRGAQRMASNEGVADDFNKVKIALCQLMVGENKDKNIIEAEERVSEAAEAGAKIISLPECWNSPYATTSFPEYAELVPALGETPNAEMSPSVTKICQMAEKFGVYLIGGSVPERDGEQIYNTCVVASPSGRIVGKHRKMHLFDIDVPGKITFKESDTLTGGDAVTVVETEYGKIGIGICYDIRFPELALVMRQRGCSIFIYPGAFNTVTGPAHWELLQRARAVDNQVFVATCSPARNPDSSYQAWGHSTVVNPWGEVLATTEHDPDIVYAELDLAAISGFRQSIPVSFQKRHDIYEVIHKEDTGGFKKFKVDDSEEKKK
mmetsp:Transcript_33903/g.44721  ORF Transcript_33903/g.44721 Transcript_33903/m.44721 type:complete len:419 (-) Transcript_33903:343-1599(-)